MDNSQTDSITITDITGQFSYVDASSISNGASITGISVPWTTTSGTSDTFTLDSSWNRPASGKIKLDGPDADIEINGESLIDMLKTIEQRLNILTPDPRLEADWEQLRNLGDQYRALEKSIQEKMKIWDAISK
jgi:hypothetical protein